MRATRRFGITLALVVAGCGPRLKNYGEVTVSRAPASLRSNDDMVRKSADAVAVVETDAGRGLAFVIDPSGYLLTARHVIENADYIESVRFPSRGAVYESVQVVYTDVERDLALLEIKTDEALPSLSVASWSRRAGGPAQRDPIVVFKLDGDKDVDEGQRLVAHNGAVSELSIYNDTAGPGAFLGVTVDVQKGQSGGPVLDRHGRVLGVVTWTFRDRVGGYAIPIDEVTRMLAERPVLDNASDHRLRAVERTRAFLHALADGDVDDARRSISPSHAKQRRAETVEQILGSMDDQGRDVVRGFLEALDTLVEQPREVQARVLQDIVSRTTTTPFREAMSMGPEVDDGQIISLFFELGRGYLEARTMGADRDAALQESVRQLHTVEVARTFALADAIGALAGNELVIETVQVVPGAYSPRAIVSLRAGGEKVSVHMKLEWGDWYVADVGRTPITARGPQVVHEL